MVMQETPSLCGALTLHAVILVRSANYCMYPWTQDELGCGLPALTPELAVVQDADRLDAMGAIGIARCFTFGGRFNRVLHDPSVPPREGLTRQQYTDRGFQQTTYNHFHEKLLKLKVPGLHHPHQ